MVFCAQYVLLHLVVTEIVVIHHSALIRCVLNQASVRGYHPPQYYLVLWMVGNNVKYNPCQEYCILVGCRLVLCNFFDLISYHYSHT